MNKLTNCAKLINADIFCSFKLKKKYISVFG